MTNPTKSFAVTVLLLAAGCGSTSSIESSHEYLATGRIGLAFHELERAYEQQAAAGSVDPELEREYRELRPTYLTEKARQLIYADRPEAGLETLEEVLALVPDSEAALSLVTRAHKKLADRETRAGEDLLSSGQYEEAMIAFGAALKQVPGHEPAIEGIKKVRETISRLHAEAQEQYLAAIRKLPEFRYPEVDWHARIAVSRDPSREDAVQLRNKALQEQAESAMERADEAKAEGVYGAALMEYRSARNYWPSIPGVEEHIEHMAREVKAQQTIERATLMLNADRLEEARARLTEALALTSLQAGWINELQHMIRKREGELAYERARDLELQGMKAEALAGFEKVAADWPGGLLDEKVRISALRLDIAGAAEAYALGESKAAAGELEAALEQFTTAQTYYEGYRDVAERIRVLREAIAAKSGG